MSGRMVLKYTDDRGGTAVDRTIDLGTIVSISNTVQKRGQVTPIVSQNMQSAFPIETGNSQTYSISFKRVQPQGWTSSHDTGTDSRRWSNAHWYSMLTDAVDRWQTRTNGTRLEYTSRGENAYLPDLYLDGYIRSLSRTYSNSYNEVISGTLEFTVGTMYINERKTLDPTRNESYGDMYIMMSDAQGDRWFVILYPRDTTGQYSCVESFTITGGLEDPFEHATIRIPKKKLMEQIPVLAEPLGIIDGCNKIFIKGMGEHAMFVDQVETGDTIVLKAFTNAQCYKSVALGIEMQNRPSRILRDILMDPTYGVAFDEDHIIYKYQSSLDSNPVTIPAGTMVYRALQICATMLKCRLFFADNKAYFVDYTVKSGITSGYARSGNPFISEISNVNLRDRNSFGRRTIGTSTTDETGLAPVKNQATIVCRKETDNGNVSSTVTPRIDGSISVFRTLDKGTIQVPELTEDQALVFGMNHLEYICEAQQSITFTIKEVYHESGQLDKVWESFFGPSALLDSIDDEYTSVHLTNRSIRTDKAVAPQKLALSTYTRQYPKGTCEYTFGMIASVSLSDNESQTNNTLNVSR